MCMGFIVWVCVCVFFFFKQKTAYEMRISDWSSDVCSSDLQRIRADARAERAFRPGYRPNHLLRLDAGPAGSPLFAAELDAGPRTVGRRRGLCQSRHRREEPQGPARKSVGMGKRWSARVNLGCRRSIKKNTTTHNTQTRTT